MEIIKCKFCEKQFNTIGARNSHQGQCVKNPERNMFSSIKQECICEFCNTRFIKTKAAFTLHKRTCKFNPNRKPVKGHFVSDDTKEKLKQNAGGYRKNAGRGKRGYYKGLYCMSSWELAFVYYQLDHGKEVLQCTERFEYMMNGEVHHYTPDFIIDGVYYEIKNWHRPDTDFKVNQFPNDKTLVLIEGIKNEKYLKYVKDKYGENFYDILYEVKDYTISKKELEYLKIKEERWNLIQSSTIDFSKYGWVKEASKLFGISINKAGQYIKQNFPEFYEKECFKQKRGVYPQSDKLQKG